MELSSSALSPVKPGLCVKELRINTVALQKLRPARTNRGSLYWRREYAFDYSTNGTDRQQGLLILQGRSVLQLNMLSRRELFPEL